MLCLCGLCPSFMLNDSSHKPAAATGLAAWTATQPAAHAPPLCTDVGQHQHGAGKPGADGGAVERFNDGAGRLALPLPDHHHTHAG